MNIIETGTAPVGQIGQVGGSSGVRASSPGHCGGGEETGRKTCESAARVTVLDRTEPAVPR